MSIFMIISIICAFIVKGLCGFANTLVFTTMMSFQTSNINISPVELIVGYPSNIIMVWKERKSLVFKVWGPLVLLVMAGCIPGTFLLKNINSYIIKIIFGIAVVFIGSEMLIREHKKTNKKSSPVLLGVIGLASGLLSGLFGVGALLAAYVSRTTEDNSSFRGNLCIVFFIENTFRIILYSLTGIISLSSLKTALILIPFMLLGLFIGISLSKIINERNVKKIVITMLIISGLSLVINNILIL